MISVEDAEEYTQSLGQIVGGSWRQIAWAARMGIPEALGLTTQDWVEQRLGGYVRLTVSDRRKAAKELTAPPEEGGMGMSGPEAADVLGVSDETVYRDLGKRSTNVESESDGLHHLSPVSTNVESEPEPGMPAPGDTEAEWAAGFLDEDEGVGEDEDGAEDIDAESTAEMAAAVGIANAPPAPDSSGSAVEQKQTTRELLAQSDQNDWRTPRKFLVAARAVLGAIDLDPATSAEANETVEAAQCYTEDDDGLTQPWKGRVWLNPPYGGQARLFVERLVREYEVGNVTAALALVNSHPTETAWFQQLFRYTICFVRGRIDFGGPSRAVSSTSTHGSAIAYLGKDVEGFHREFSQFGAVVRAI